jgi:FkbM family methyltransferase
MTPPNEEQMEKLLVWQYFGCRRDGFFVEVGANHPFEGSQTWLLERVGWKGVLVEPLPEKADLIRKTRPEAFLFAGVATSPDKTGLLNLHIPEADAFASTEMNVDDVGVKYAKTIHCEASTLDAILQTAGLPGVDFVSIDTEGTEIHVLHGFDLERWSPSLILIEDKLRNLQKHSFLVAHGYRLVKRTTLNNWYVRFGESCYLTSYAERLKLFRKVYLGLPFRMFRHLKEVKRKARMPQQASH